MSRDPCAGCGRTTSVGSILFSDRRVVDAVGGQRDYLCADCRAAVVRRRGGGQRLTDEEVRQAVENGSAMGLVWGGGGPGIGAG